MTPKRVRTWTGETYDCANYLEPDTEAALAEAIRFAHEVRFIGTGHSMIERIVPGTGGVLIDMRRFQRMSLPERRPIGPDDEAIAVVEAGVTLHALSAALAERGWALAILPSEGAVTVAGAISTGTHNTARDTSALLSDEVLAIDALDAEGRATRFEGEDLKAARVGLGALGAIVRVTLRCVPAFDLVHTLEDADADTTFSSLDTLLARHEHLWLHWKLPANGKERVVVRTANRPHGPTGALRRIPAIVRVPGWQRGAAHVLTAIATRLPAAKAALMAVISPKPPFVGASHHVFYQHIDWINFRGASIGVPLERLPEARVALSKALRGARYQPHLPLQIRFLPASDKTLLGMNAGRSIATLEIMSMAALPDFSLGKRIFCDVLADFSPRIHWAKGGEGNIAASFPAETWRAFESVRARMDPAGKFMSPWLRAVLPTTEASLPAVSLTG